DRNPDPTGYPLAFSSDGRRFATAPADGTVRLWGATAGGEVRSLTGHPNGVSRLLFSPDGRRLFSTGEDGSAAVWDATAGRRLYQLPGRVGRVYGLAVAPDGKTLATACGTAGLPATPVIRLWDVATGMERGLLAVEGGVSRMRFSPDGHRLAV